MEFHKIVNEVNLHFRAPVTLCLVWILWGINVWVFRKCSIDYCKVLKFSPRTALYPSQIVLSGIGFLLMVVLFRLFFAYCWPAKSAFLVPISLWLSALLLFFMPFDVFHRVGRMKLMHTFYRLLVPLETGVLFVEVVLGDILTSLSKALSDIQISLCVLLSSPLFSDPDVHMNSFVDLSPNTYEERCAESWLRPLVTSIPFIIRFRQCIVNYRATGDAFPHLVNAAKYASSLPVIWLSAFAHVFPDSYSYDLRKAWLISISFNSFFSFMWDILMDWGLCRQGSRYFLLRDDLRFISVNNDGYRKTSFNETSLFFDADENEQAPDSPSPVMVVEDNPELFFRGSKNSSESNKEEAAHLVHPSLPPKLLKPLLPQTPILYYCAIILDFVLRVLWSFKLSVHLQLSQGGLTFILEICEVLRRFLWLFFRIEWQVIDEMAQEVEATEREMQEDISNIIGHDIVDADIQNQLKVSGGIVKEVLRSRLSSDRSKD